MRDSSIPPEKGGGNKAVLILMVGATLLMGAALVVLLVRDDTPSPAPAAETPPPDVYVPSPALVATRPARPIDDKGDTATTAPVPPPPKKGKKGRVTPEEPTGTIDRGAVNRLINANFTQVKACYERRLKVNSFLEGVLDLNIGILESGKVDSVGVNRDTIRDAQMLICVKSTIRGWTFPKPDGGRVIIGKTFTFKKKGM